MRSNLDLALSRRGFSRGLTGLLTTLGMGTTGAGNAAQQQGAATGGELRDAALRGLARNSALGDAVLVAQAQAALARLQNTDPEGALLVQIYQRFDVASAAYSYSNVADDENANANLASLHKAIRECRTVSFSYTDLEGEVTTRAARPLAIVHPPQGIKLLAWCEKRQANRQFFVRAISGLAEQPKQFASQRLVLLQQLAGAAG